MGRTVAVDLDEVLGFFIQQLCKFHNDEYGTNLSQSDFFSYTFADVSGTCNQRLHRFTSRG